MWSWLRSSCSTLGLLAACCVCLACAGERAALLRGQAYYEDNQFERALAIWRNLERRQASLGSSDFARYAYLRGMTDYRLGFHLDARHWLGLAHVAHRKHPSALDPAWVQRLDGALSDLNRRQFGLTGVEQDAVQSIEAPPATDTLQTPAAPGTEPLAPPISEPPPAQSAPAAPAGPRP